MTRLALTIGGIAAVVAGGLAWQRFGDRPNVVDAIGGQWEVQQATWVQIDEAWLLSANLRPYAVHPTQAKVVAVLNGFCDALLAARPLAPRGVQAADDLFRIDINFTMQDDRDAVPEYAFDRRRTIRIEDGACDDVTEGEVVFPTYPGVLSAWRLESIEPEEGDEGMIAKFIFEPRDGFDVELSDLDLLKACQAVLRDPATSEVAMVARQTGKVALADAIDDAQVVLITAQKSWGLPIVFSASRSRGASFGVAGGICVRGDQEDA